jgi:hypothetical protein
VLHTYMFHVLRDLGKSKVQQTKACALSSIGLGCKRKRMRLRAAMIDQVEQEFKELYT